MKALAGGWTLTGTGVLLGLGTSLAVAITGPSWFDPARSCRYRFDEDRTFTAVKRAFPPSATCVRDDGQRFEYLSSGMTTGGAVLLAVAALLLIVGVAVLAAAWLRRDALPEPPPAGGRGMHLWLALLLGVTLTVVVTGVGIGLYAVIGIFTAVFFAVPVLLGAAVLAALFDKAAGPRAPGRRRRGTAVAVGGGLAGTVLVEAAFTIDAVSDWALLSLPLAAVLYVAIAAVQHLRTRGTLPA